MLTRKELIRKIKRITGDLSDLRESTKVQADYWNAIRTLNLEKLTWYWSFGETTRHQVMNVNEFIHGQRFGFNTLLFNEYGWLANSNWECEEEIELRTKEDNAMCNRITLAQGPNGFWAYGINYNFGTGSGGGFAPSVFGERHSSRSTCLDTALVDLKTRMKETIKHATVRPDPCNYNITYMNKILKKIEEEFSSQSQLTLFA